MNRTHLPSSMLGRTADFSASPMPRTLSRSEKGLLPLAARPEEVRGLLRGLIETGQISKARRLTVEAARRFPNNDEVRLAKHVLAESKTTSSPYTQATATAEIEWLKNPPQEARGKWVALIGSELIGMADSPEELKRSLETREFDQYPVVQHLAPRR